MILTPAVVELGVAIVLFAVAAGIAVPTAVHRYRHRRFTATTSAHQALRDSHASWLVDHAVKVLAQACAWEPRLVPGVVMVVLHDDAISLHLSTPTAHPPAPWRNSADGLVWSATLVELQSQPLSPETANPFTGLITLGVSDAGRVFVDLGQAHGLVSIGGDLLSRHRVTARWIAEAGSRPWAAGRATLVGLGEAATPRPTPDSTLDELVDRVASGDVGLAFVESLPDDVAAALLVQGLESHACRLPVVVASHVASARWRFTAHANGWVTSDFLPAARWNPEAAALPAVAPTAAVDAPARAGSAA
jgi:hypothetical protein